MTAEATPAVKRAIDALLSLPASGVPQVVTSAMTAALDIDDLAQIIYEAIDASTESPRPWERLSLAEHHYWRDIARAVRAGLLGGPVWAGEEG